MTTVKANFRRFGGLVYAGTTPGGAILPPSVGATLLTASGAIFLSGSQLYVFNGTNFTGFSAAVSASGS